MGSVWIIGVIDDVNNNLIMLDVNWFEIWYMLVVVDLILLVSNVNFMNGLNVDGGGVIWVEGWFVFKNLMV